MREITLTLTEDELNAVGATLRKWRQDYNLKKDASLEARKFDDNLISAIKKINDKEWEVENGDN